MGLTQSQLEEIISSPLSTPAQQSEAEFHLSELLSKQTEAAEAEEPEIDTATGQVKVRPFRGQTFAKAGCWKCHESSRDVMYTSTHDLPGRVISTAYAKRLSEEFAAFGGLNGGEAAVAVDHYFTFGKVLATTSEEQAAWLAAFPTVRSDIFSRPDPKSPEQVAREAKDRAQLAAHRRLKELADTGKWGLNCYEDWMHTDSKLPDGEEGAEIVQLLTVILEDLTAVRRRGETLEFKWRDMTKLLPKEETPAPAQIAQEQP